LRKGSEDESDKFPQLGIASVTNLRTQTKKTDRKHFCKSRGLGERIAGKKEGGEFTLFPRDENYPWPGTEP